MFFNIFSKKFSLSHDRFDFGKHCRTAGGAGKNRQACKILKKGGFDASVLSEHLKKYLETNNVGVNTVYFATTPSQKKFAEELKGNLTEIGLRLLNIDDLEEYIGERWANCEKDELRLVKHDFVSQLEQEICMNSKRFLWSDSSSWSVAVQFERDIRRWSLKDESNRVLF